ncbi:RDD family protein [Streptomyces sp. B-S-A8]|uniref:RDD family protein n=1 Tax=Streptomyces solicavernae TaxID=3043614 RepID=A0ABT6RS03_9ACTN|nr:RDD family protein [Streptomyces sp. B-S-A8]MDI3387208.1 RDD family protein [Streptomyces sp. B-S-A8]
MSVRWGRMAYVINQQPPQNQPYAPQPTNPYQANPYQQHPQQQSPPQYPQQHPQPHPQQYQRQAPSEPEEVGDYRRGFAATVDGLIALLGGFALAEQLAGDKSVGAYWGCVAGLILGVSFVHHVLGALIFRATVGKFLFTSRVVRAEDAGRPRFWQTVRRWLLGLTWLPMQPVLSLTNDDGDPYEDGCGLRYVRSRDLR